MSKQLLNETLAGNSVGEQTGSLSTGNKMAADVVIIGGTTLNPLAKFVEAIYTNSDMTVTYNYYESSSKVTLYSSITTIYTAAQDTEFTSAEWS